jgi:signal transduction histidine kinase
VHVVSSVSHSHVEGTGIGLFSVKRITDTTGSTIEVVSKEGEGTFFQVHLRDQLTA